MGLIQKIVHQKSKTRQNFDFLNMLTERCWSLKPAVGSRNGESGNGYFLLVTCSTTERMGIWEIDGE